MLFLLPHTSFISQTAREKLCACIPDTERCFHRYRGNFLLQESTFIESSGSAGQKFPSVPLSKQSCTPVKNSYRMWFWLRTAHLHVSLAITLAFFSSLSIVMSVGRLRKELILFFFLSSVPSRVQSEAL